MYVQLVTAFLPLVIATTVLLLITKARAAAAAAAAHGQQQPQPPPQQQPQPQMEQPPAQPEIAPPSTPIAPANALSLRFLLGERPLLSLVCDASLPLREVKSAVYAALVGVASSSSSSSPPPRVLLIFQGVMLADDRTLRDYPQIEPDAIVHVHVIAAAGHISAQPAPPLQQLHHRGAAAAAVGPVPAFAHLIPPARLMLGPNVHAQLAVQLPPHTVYRSLFAMFISVLGVLWGMVLVFGGTLFSLNALLGLIFLSGIGVVGFVSAIGT